MMIDQSVGHVNCMAEIIAEGIVLHSVFNMFAEADHKAVHTDAVC